MKKPFIIMIVLGVLVIGGIFTMRGSDKSTDSTQSNTQTATAPNEVIMQGLEFKTRKLTVKKGTTVTWRNLDDAKHNIAFDSGSKAGTEGELFGRDQSYAVTFDEVGTYDYHCRPHPYMKATIEVTE